MSVTTRACPLEAKHQLQHAVRFWLFNSLPWIFELPSNQAASLMVAHTTKSESEKCFQRWEGVERCSVPTADCACETVCRHLLVWAVRQWKTLPPELFLARPVNRPLSHQNQICIYAEERRGSDLSTYKGGTQTAFALRDVRSVVAFSQLSHVLPHCQKTSRVYTLELVWGSSEQHTLLRTRFVETDTKPEGKETDHWQVFRCTPKTLVTLWNVTSGSCVDARVLTCLSSSSNRSLRFDQYASLAACADQSHGAGFVAHWPLLGRTRVLQIVVSNEVRCQGKLGLPALVVSCCLCVNEEMGVYVWRSLSAPY